MSRVLLRFVRASRRRVSRSRSRAAPAAAAARRARTGRAGGKQRRRRRRRRASRGELAALVEAGGICATAADCKSGFCFDGVCCRSDCSGACQSCAVEGSVGTCTDVPVGADPRNDCPDDGVASCGRNGSCDGTGACALYAAGRNLPRAILRRIDGQPRRALRRRGRVRRRGRRIPAARTCATPRGGACRADCATSADCVGGAACVNGSCGPKPPGAACTAAGDCASGFCVAGVCCATACDGTCRSCAVAGQRRAVHRASRPAPIR